MATYYSGPNNQRDAAPAIYLPGSFPETPVIPGNMMMYVSSGSYPDALSGNSQQQNNCIEFQSVEAPVSTQNQEMLSSMGGGPRVTEHDFNTWRDGRNDFVVMHSNILQGGQNLQGQGLSLSLGTQIPSAIQIPSNVYRNSDSGFGSLLSPNSLVAGDSSGRGGNGSSRDDQSRNLEYLRHGFIGNNHDSYTGDMSPYGMTSIARTIPNSKYLKATQQLLDEVVNVRKALKQPEKEKNPCTNDQETDSGKEGDSKSNNGPSNPEESSNDTPNELSQAERQDLQNKLTKLLSMSDEVDRRYKQYYHQMQIVVSSLDVIAGNGSAKPYTALALQTISRHFRCLRDAITGQIKATRKSLGEQETSENGKGVGITRLRYVDQQLRQQRALQQLGMMQQHAWRPQRGLPESSVSILRAWLFEHFLHPYPKDSDKIMLARQTGLTRSQVSNWFINARVRLWKPMVEEMYKEEMGDADIDSNSSSENAAKATKGDNTGGYEDNREEMQLSSTSNAATTERCSTGQLIDSKANHFPDTELAGTATRSTFQNGLRGEALTEYGLLYQMSEIGRFGNGNGVSLTLGLQHCEDSGLPISATPHHSFVSLTGNENMYNAAASVNPVGHETSDFELINNGNRQHRYSSSHLLHDFVA